MKKKVVPTLRQEVKVKVDILTSDDIKIYYTGKFQDFTARYLIRIDIFFSKMHLAPFHRERLIWLSESVVSIVVLKNFENFSE